MCKYKVHEIFYSIQGEGPQIGMPAVFIRLSGCNLNCSYCDSKYANIGTQMTKEEIVDDVCIPNPQSRCPNVVITGGEPMIQDLLPLMKALIAKNKNIYIESNGTVFDPTYIGFARFVISPKVDQQEKIFSSSYHKSLHKWSQHATFKFVIDTYQDLSKAINLIENITPKRFYFMPQTITAEDHYHKLHQLIDWVKEIYPKAWVSPRLQIYLYDTKKGV